jgi:hypothetical protein
MRIIRISTTGTHTNENVVDHRCLFDASAHRRGANLICAGVLRNEDVDDARFVASAIA